MRLKTIILFIICAFGATIPTVRAQLAFEPSEWDFGTIRETDGPVSHTFTGKNGSDRPLVILDVVTTCGCTVPEFSKQPILPGAETRITVTYDPANRPGAFDRELWVYSSDRKRIATLTIRGQVTPRPKSIEEQYPVDAGGGLRLSSTLCAFSYIYPGKRMQSVIGYANTSPREIRLELRPEITSGLLSADYPQTIGPGGPGADQPRLPDPRRPAPLRHHTRCDAGFRRRTEPRRADRHARHRSRQPCRDARRPGPAVRNIGKYP